MHVKSRNWGLMKTLRVKYAPVTCIAKRIVMFHNNRCFLVRHGDHYWFHTAQKMKFSIKDFFSKCNQIRRKLRIWSHLLKKSLMGNFVFCAVLVIGRSLFEVQQLKEDIPSMTDIFFDTPTLMLLQFLRISALKVA